MSKRHPTCEAEGRWRANYRYRRMRALWRDEMAIGDPLGLAAEMQEAGTMALLDLAVLTTARHRRDDRDGDPNMQSV